MPTGFSPSADNTDKSLAVYVIDIATDLTVGDAKAAFRIQNKFNGMNLVAVAIGVGDSKSSSGLIDVDIARLRAATAGAASRTEVVVLSTNVTIDVDEWDSKDATTPPVINSANDDVQEGDIYRIDIDGAGTGAKGLFMNLEFDLP